MTLDMKLQSARVNVYNNENGNSYTVVKHDDLWICDCESFKFCIEPKSCKHIERVTGMLWEIIPDNEE